MKKTSLRVLSAVLTLLMLASVFTGLSVSAATSVGYVSIFAGASPVPGANPYEFTGYYNAGDEGAVIDSYWWFNESAGAKVPDNGTVKFQSGSSYSFYAVVKTEDASFELANNIDAEVVFDNWTTTKTATVTQYEDKDLKEYRLLKATFPALLETKISEVRLEGVSTTINHDTEGIIPGKLVSGLIAREGYLVDSEGRPIDGGNPNYTVTSYETCVWASTSETTWEWVTVTDPEATFEVGKKYMLRATLTANDPYYFSTNAAGKPNVDAVWAYGPTSALSMTNSRIGTTNHTNDTLALTYQFPAVENVKIPVTSPYATFGTPHYFDQINFATLAPSLPEGFSVEEIKVSKYNADSDFYAAIADGTYIGDVEHIFGDLSSGGLFEKAPRYQVVAKLKLGEGYSITPEELDKFAVYGGYNYDKLTTDRNQEFFYEFYENAGFYWVKYYFTPSLDPDMVYAGDVWYEDHGIKGGADADDAAAALFSDARVGNFPYNCGPEGTLLGVKFLDAEGEDFHQTLVGGETYTLRSEIIYPATTKIYEPMSESDRNYWFDNITSDLVYQSGSHKTTIGTYKDAYEKLYKKVTIDTPVTVVTDFKAGESCEWKFDGSTGTLEIKGTSDMYDYKMLDVKPWEGIKNDIKKVVFEHGIVHIGNYAFNELPNLEEVEISGMVCSIGNGAFRDCPKLKKVTFDQYITLETIGSSVFENDAALTEIALPATVKEIGGHAFENTGLTSVEIPAAVKEIGEGAFRNVKLAEINLPAALETIGGFAFVGATDKEVAVPESVTGIGDYALGYSSVTQIPGEGTAPSTWDGTPVEGFKIIAQAGTAAYRYAVRNNIPVEYTNFVVKFDNVLEYEIMGESFKYGSIQEKFCSADEEITIPTQTTTGYDMYSFGGWQIEGEETIYQGGDTYKVTKDVTFKAIWTSTPVVTYDDGNGNKRTDPVSTTGEYKFMRCYFTAPEGKIFAGWQVVESIYQPGDTLTVSDSFTATAVWADAVTVSFDADGGTGDMDAVKIAKDTEFTLPECEFTAPEGKAFKCWNVTWTDFNQEYAPGDVITPAEDAKVFAVWADAVTVSFDADGAAGEMPAFVVAKDGEITLPECTFTAPEGMVFVGWLIGENSYNVGDRIILDADVSVKAMWGVPVNVYTITFDGNGAEGTFDPAPFNEGETFIFPDCPFTAPEGKAFGGWQVGETIYNVDDTLVITSDITVTAVWVDAAPELIDISAFTVEGIKNKAYTGKEITLDITVKNGETPLTADDYDVVYTNNKKVGTATFAVIGKGAYTGTIEKTFKITKAKNKMTVKASKKTMNVKYSKVKKKNQKVTKAITIKNAKGTVSCKITSVPKKFKKFVKISSKGVFTVKKGAKKGTYKLKVKVTAKGNKSFKSASKTVKVTIKVK